MVEFKAQLYYDVTCAILRRCGEFQSHFASTWHISICLHYLFLFVRLNFEIKIRQTKVIRSPWRKSDDISQRHEYAFDKCMSKSLTLCVLNWSRRCFFFVSFFYLLLIWLPLSYSYLSCYHIHYLKSSNITRTMLRPRQVLIPSIMMAEFHLGGSSVPLSRRLPSDNPTLILLA